MEQELCQGPSSVTLEDGDGHTQLSQPLPSHGLLLCWSQGPCPPPGSGTE